jgi:phosphohistidine phosphatase
VKRRLFIVRHGKSSWEEQGLADIDRPLAKRGLRNSDTMARRLKDLGMVPTLIFSSPARRARNTAQIMAEIWGLEASRLVLYEELYMATSPEILEVIARAPANTGSLAIFGHNPSFTIFANAFLEFPLENLPTAGVVVVTMKCDSWKEIGRSKVVETYVDYPKKGTH